jgi:hypothetical protein
VALNGAILLKDVIFLNALMALHHQSLHKEFASTVTNKKERKEDEKVTNKPRMLKRCRT